MTKYHLVMNKARQHRMYQFARETLPVRFPRSEGWKVFEWNNKTAEVPDFFIEKQGAEKNHWILVDVVTSNQIEQKHLEHLKWAASLFQGEKVKVVGFGLVVPAGADKRAVPSDWMVMEWKMERKKRKEKKPPRKKASSETRNTGKQGNEEVGVGAPYTH